MIESVKRIPGFRATRGSSGLMIGKPKEAALVRHMQNPDSPCCSPGVVEAIQPHDL